MLRRVAALLVLLTTFHLSVVTGDAACADHGASPAPSGHAMTADMGMSHDVHASAAVEVPEPPCEVPAQRHCCEAVAGCGVVVDVSAVACATQPAAPSAKRVSEPAGDMPASFAAAPEPPPPKP